MCEVRIIHVEVVPKTIEPTISFRLGVSCRDAQQVVVAVSGGLFMPSDTFVGPAFEWPKQDSDDQGLQAALPNAGERQKREHWWMLAVRLGRRQLDHIESTRERDHKKDVHLDLEVSVRVLSSTAEPWPMGEVEAKIQPGVRLVATVNPTNARRVLMESDGYQGSFLRFKTIMSSIRHRIPSADWVHEFAPKLGLGTFEVVEIPDPSDLKGDLGERMAKAFEAARKARQSLRAGEWEDVCQDLRQVWELLRDTQFLGDLVRKDGYHDQAASSLCSALNGFYDLAAKFDHALARDRTTILPELKARKEDAYLVFANAMSVLNFIARKLQRTSARS
jgi:hypothetical protein